VKRLSILLILAVVFLPGCLLDGSNPAPELYETDLSIPGNLLKNMVTSYNERESAPYANLLAEDFNFRFAPGREAEEYPDGLTRAKDLLFTGNMFGSRDVVDVRLAMTWGEPEDALWKGEEAVVLSLVDLTFDVELDGDLIFRVGGDPQDFYFRLGKESLGEDPLRYYMVGWVDHGRSFAPTDVTPKDWTPVEDTSWGSIKARFN